MFSYEICKIFNNTYFEEHLQTTAATQKSNIGKILVKKISSQSFTKLIRYYCWHTLFFVKSCQQTDTDNC